MSTTQLSDIVKPEIYGNYTNEPSVELNALFQSGVIVTSQLLQSKANSGGQTINLPFWKDLSKTEPNISSDDPAEEATPLKVQGAKQVARISHLNQAWSTMDLATEISGSDPMGSVRARLNQYWAEQFQRRLVATIQGVVADSVANHSSDLIKDDSALAFNASGFLAAAQTLGDHKGMLRSLVVHSEVQRVMAENDLIQYLPDSSGNFILPTYKGLQLIQDDEVNEPSAGVYDCYLVGAGAIGSAAGTPAMPLEVERGALKGNGGGSENLVSRVTPIVHPFGYAWSDSTVAGDSPTLAELKLADNWTRVLTSRKSIPMAVYRCALEDAA